MTEPDPTEPVRAAHGSARVELGIGTRLVVVEAPEPLDQVAATARTLWPLTGHHDRGGASLGFGVTERADGPAPRDLELPAHMTEWEPDF